MRICLFGQGPLCEAVKAALAAQGHILLGPFASPQSTEALTSTQASVGLSCGYRHKLKAEEWECFPDGILNLHTGYLPWNRGAYPNVWPILDGSPAGVTLHRVDAGWDTGPILAQRTVTVEPWDTAGTLYDKLLAAGVMLVGAAVGAAGNFGWPDGTPQNLEAGNFHRKADWERYRRAAEHLSGEQPDLIQDLRAASFLGYGFRYRQDGKLIEATITLKEVREEVELTLDLARKLTTLLNRPMAPWVDADTR